jgi:hypothetical protein
MDPYVELGKDLNTVVELSTSLAKSVRDLAHVVQTLQLRVRTLEARFPETEREAANG